MTRPSLVAATLLALPLLCSPPAAAFTVQDAADTPASLEEALATLVPEAPEGAVPWTTFARVEESWEERDGIGVMVPVFDPAVAALDGARVTVRGYMFPLEADLDTRHFLLTALPPSCPSCLPAGPWQMIGVEAERPVEFVDDPVVIEGRLALLEDDETGLFYRLTGARAAK